METKEKPVRVGRIWGHSFKTKKGYKVTVGYKKSHRVFIIAVEFKDGKVETMAFTPKSFKELTSRMFYLLAEMEGVK